MYIQIKCEKNNKIHRKINTKNYITVRLLLFITSMTNWLIIFVMTHRFSDDEQSKITISFFAVVYFLAPTRHCRNDNSQQQFHKLENFRYFSHFFPDKKEHWITEKSNQQPMKVNVNYNDEMNNILLFNAHTTNATNGKETNLGFDQFSCLLLLILSRRTDNQTIQIWILKFKSKKEFGAKVMM